MLGPRSQAHRFLSLFPFSVRCLHVFTRFVSCRDFFLRSCLFERETFLFFFFFSLRESNAALSQLISFLRIAGYSRVYVCVLMYCLCVSFTQVSAYKYINVPCACVCIMIEDVSRFVACNDSVGCVCRSVFSFRY